jgi:hypothetical protein
MQDFEKLGVFYLGREVDPSRGQPTDNVVLYDSRDLTTHAVCVGMTGSGKTGLCLALLEEAAIDGIPAIAIDPKGDLGNLMLTFPNLAPADFRPWIDPQEAARKGFSVDDFATATAATWRKGLADWGQSPERIARFQEAVDVSIYTPGSNAGLALSVVKSFAPPVGALATDAIALRDRINAVVSGILGLLGIDADPLKSREHILLANLFEAAWRDGRSLDMAGIIGEIQKPPFDKVGVFDLETFFPAKDRLGLAMAVNNLLASPGFAAWMTGEPLDIQRLLFTPAGKPRLSIISIAHLGDAERMFFVTLLLNEAIAWMRTQSGTSSLRALLYMDEIFGFFPPTAMPPSKTPMLTLLKQARAFGFGVVLATQNPVDLDYKGLSNAGTWLIGRLQTERDKQRVIEGIESALATTAASFDHATIDRLLSGLGSRMFLMRNVHDDAPTLMQSRWALSYLRGPLTLSEIQTLMAARRPSGPSAAPSPAAVTTTATAPATTTKPNVPADVTEYFLRATSGTGPITYKPAVVGFAKLHYIDAKSATDVWQSLVHLAPFSDDGKDVLWAEAKALNDFKSQVDMLPASGAAFASLPASALRAQIYRTWAEDLADSLYQTSRLQLRRCDPLKLSSQPEETEGDFRARLDHAARENRDATVDRIRNKYESQLMSLQDQIRRAEDRVAREQAQYSQQKVQSAISIGATVLGALFGRSLRSVGNVGRATTAARSASRIGREKEDVVRADESLDVLKQRLAALQTECEQEVARLQSSLDAGALALTSQELAPRKSDIAVGTVALAWTPWRTGTDGFPAPAS